MTLTEKLISLQTIVIHEFRRMARIWMQTILPPIISTLLYFIIFGQVMGNRIGTINGYTYAQFIAPGLIMMSIITNSYSATVSSFFMAKFQRSIEELLVSPMPNWVMIVGYMCGGILRGLCIGIIVTIISLFFTHLHLHSFFAMIFSALLASSIFSLAGIINGIFAKKFDDITIVPTFILTPLTYLGGVFYSIHFLPKVWQAISFFNPIVYIVGNFRYGFLGIAEGHIFAAFVIMIGFTLLFYLISLKLLSRSVGLKE